MNTVDITQLGVAYGGRQVLRDVNLTLADNQFVTLLGANGAGKTTLLRTLLGLVPVQSGRLSVLGQAPGLANHAIGYVAQTRSNQVTAGITGRDFIASVVRGERWGWPYVGKQAQREIDWALDKVQATELSRRALAEMSGGERQRLLLAQALLGRPRLLLLDEPLISLDMHHQSNIIHLVKNLQLELGLTVIFSAHEINPLLGVVDQVLYLGSGQAAIGTVEQVITADVLTRLYGTPIEVIRQAGRIFVMAGDTAVEQLEHCHDV